MTTTTVEADGCTMRFVVTLDSPEKAAKGMQILADIFREEKRNWVRVTFENVTLRDGRPT